MERTQCKKCGNEYVYDKVGTVYPGGKDREDVICPYCGNVDYSEMTSQYFVSYKLDSNGNPDYSKGY